MIKKLIQHGNSSALIIEKPILELLDISADTPLDIRTDGRSLIVTPVSAELKKSIDRVNKRHGKTLRKLAK